ncbi:MAG TPA: VOC family protein [Gaiellaceae bacterium]|nr:VOC family protein [Gaiellaceae bacterium]
MAVQPIPDGYRTVTPYLTVDGAKKAIEFYKRAFGAEERSIMPGPGDTIGHAELQIGDSIVMLSDPFPQSSIKAPTALGGTTAGVFLYVEDVDEVFKQAIDAGATETMAPEKMFWGDRFGSVTDPFGHSWQIATHVEDVSPEDMAERAKEAMASMAG